MEKIDHPPHYGGDTTYEHIKVVRAWGLGYNLGIATKHICRAGKKETETRLDDLKKARWYLQNEIEYEEKNAPVQTNRIEAKKKFSFEEVCELLGDALRVADDGAVEVAVRCFESGDRGPMEALIRGAAIKSDIARPEPPGLRTVDKGFSPDVKEVVEWSINDRKFESEAEVHTWLLDKNIHWNGVRIDPRDGGKYYSQNGGTVARIIENGLGPCLILTKHIENRIDRMAK